MLRFLSSLLAATAVSAAVADSSVPFLYDKSLTQPDTFALSIQQATLVPRSSALVRVLDGCHTSDVDDTTFFGQPACFLTSHAEVHAERGLALSASSPLPFRIALHGPSRSEDSVSVDIQILGGDVTVEVLPQFEDAHAAAAAVSTDATGQCITVLLPASAHITGHLWEMRVAAVPTTHAGVVAKIESAVLNKAAAIAATNAADAAAAGEDAAVSASVVLRLRERKADAPIDDGIAVDGPINNPTPLVSGLPQIDYVGLRLWQYYTFSQPNPLPAAGVHILLTPISTSDPDLYVTLSTTAITPPTQTAWDYRANRFGTDVVNIGLNDTQVRSRGCAGATGQCFITIGVYGYTPSNFSITATRGGGTTTLTPSLPWRDSLPATGAIKYYAMPSVVALPSARISFALWCYSGDGDLFVSNSGPGGSPTPGPANASSYCAFSNYASRDVVEIYPGTPCYCTPPCTYYASVFAFAGPVDYTITGAESATAVTTLLDGQPASGFVLQGSSDQYVINLQFATPANAPAFRRIVTAVLQSYLGDADMFVTLDGRVPTMASYDYASTSWAAVDAVTVRASDARFAASPCGLAAATNGSCAVRIGVVAWSTAIYALVATTASAYTQLVDGSPQGDVVDGGAYAYFRFSLLATPPGATMPLVSFTLLATSGDPDLYCGSDANNNTVLPTNARGTYIWRSAGTTMERIDVWPGDAGACSPPCSYYCGVLGYGANNASFVLTAATASAVPGQLVIGQPQPGTVYGGLYRRYRAQFNSTLTVSVTPLSGDPDLFVRLDTALVTTANFQYSSMAGSGIDSVTILPSDDAFVANCSAPSLFGGCTANIAVYGWGPVSTYSIVASVDTSVLADGVAVTASVPTGLYAYYTYTAANRQPITVSVTPLTGDPDLFVSLRGPRANATNWQWQSAGLTTEVLYLQWSDPRLAACALPCTFFIGVQAFGAPATFSVSASSAQSVSLSPGMPVRSHAAPWSFAFFQLTVPPGATGVEFAATPLSGGALAVYVNNIVDPSSGRVTLPALTCPPPSCPGWGVANAVWSSAATPARARVAIDGTVDTRFGPGPFVAAVLALGGQAADFTMTASFPGGITTLQSGVPFQDSAARGTYNYYRLLSGLYGGDVAVLVTPISGDPDLYVSWHSSNMRPNASAWDRQSSSAGTNLDAVYVPWLLLTECQAQIDPAGGGGDCDVWIGVRGFTNTSYTVTATVVNGTQRSMLLDGVPAAGTVAFRTYTYYYAEIAVPPGTSFSVYVRTVSGNPSIYARTDGLNPSASFFQFASTQPSGDEVIFVSPASPYYNSSCTLTIAVYGVSNSSYQITLATAGAVVQLVNGAPQGGAVSLDANPYAYYAVSVDAGATTDVTLALTALAGDPDIYISVWRAPGFRPSSGVYTWAGTRFGSDAVTISGVDPNACTGCSYIAGVTCGYGRLCRYVLTAMLSPSTLISLADGQPSSNTAAAGSWRYYTFDTSDSTVASDIAFSSVSTTGNAQLYVTNGYVPGSAGTGSLPTNLPGGYVWSSAFGGNTSGSGALTIPFGSPGTRANASLYTIGVYALPAAGAASFTLTASTSAVSQTLVPGQPSPAFTVAAGLNLNFNVAVLDTSQDLLVIVTALEGSPWVAVSANNQAPSCSWATGQRAQCNATWSGAAGGTPTQVRILAANPCGPPYAAASCSAPADWRAGQYYLAVFAFGNAAATFSVSAYTSAASLRLIDGQPQEGQTAASQPPVYVLQTDYNAGLPDLRISLAAGAVPVNFYVTSCFGAGCTPAASLPGPGNAQALGSAPAGGVWDLFLSRFSAGYCSDPRGAAVCNYFVAVYPAAPCDVPACTAPFTIVAQTQGGSQTRITYASIYNNVLTQPGNVPKGLAAYYELYLNASQTVPVNLRLDACGPAAPSLYACNPSPGASRACSNPFQPSAADRTDAAPPAPATGSALLTIPAVAAANLFLAVVADGAAGVAEAEQLLEGAGAAGQQRQQQQQQRALQSASPNWAYALMVSAGAGARVLWPGTPAGLTVAALGGAVVNVSWAPATIGTTAGPGTAPALGVAYELFAAPGSFAATAAAVGTTAVPGTACGLLRWSALQPPGAAPPPVSVPNQTWAVLALQPDAAYEFNVLAVCDRNCFAASARAEAEALVQAEAAEAPAGLRQQLLQQAAEAALPIVLNGGVGGAGVAFGAPGYVIQRTAYAVTAGSSGVPPPPVDAFPVSGIVGVAAAGVALLALGVGVCWYRRAKAADHATQYATLDVSGAMDTISTPAGGAYVRGGGGGGLIASLRGLMARRGGGSGGGSSGGLNDGFGYPPSRVALADSGYSAVEDRAAGFL